MMTSFIVDRLQRVSFFRNLVAIVRLKIECVKLRLEVLLFMVMLIGFSYAKTAIASAESEQLSAQLLYLIRTPNVVAITELVKNNRPDLTADPRLAVLATIALRQSGMGASSANLATEALAYHKDKNTSPAERDTLLRLKYEEAISLWVSQGCGAARPRFERFVASQVANDNGEAHHLLAREARLFLATCSERNQWTPKITYAIGYESNLANTTEQKTITPEDGSHISTLIKSIAEAFPDAEINQEITLGEEPISGSWLAIKPSLTRSWQTSKRNTRLTIGAELRSTSRKDHARASASITAETSRRLGGRLIADTGITISTRHTQRGEQHKNLRENIAQFQQGLRLAMPRNLRFGAAGLIQFNKAYSSEESDYRLAGTALDLTHARSLEPIGLSGIGWQINSFFGNQETTPNHNTAKIKRFGGAIGPIRLNSKLDMSLGYTLTERRFIYARPWLTEPHHDTQHQWQIIAQYPLGQNSRLELHLGMTKTDSPDPFDDGRKWSAEIAFSH